MINPGHKRLSIVRQCELVSISRASFYRPPASEKDAGIRISTDGRGRWSS